MTIAILRSRSSLGVEAPLVSVEVHITSGLPKLLLVGLPEVAIKESKERVRSAIINSGFKFPARRITINLAPADLPKREGGRFDLLIALGILIASKQLKVDSILNYEFAGELALDGKLRPFDGALPMALAAQKDGNILVLPKESADEASLAKDLKILDANHLLDVCSHLVGSKIIIPYERKKLKENDSFEFDLSDVYGQVYVKRALEIAASGGHGLLMIGPPGVGKTMLANRLVTILPEMSDEEALETAVVYSISGKKNHFNHWKKRPFRSPHHTASSVALVGGSNPPRPGEISLAHNGVLFLDELLEFNRGVLEALREPLESKHITISRAAHQAKFPARFQLVVAMNPCPCGYYGDVNSDCNCTEDQISRYRSRISGPFLDRIDLRVLVDSRGIGSKNKGQTSLEVKSRVIKARDYAMNRSGKINSDLGSKEIERFCAISKKDNVFLENIIEKLKLSIRSYHRILKISRTIADLAHEESINIEHLKEAISYRRGL